MAVHHSLEVAAAGGDGGGGRCYDDDGHPARTGTVHTRSLYVVRRCSLNPAR